MISFGTLFACLLLSLTLDVSSACVEIAGIGDGSTDIYTWDELADFTTNPTNVRRQTHIYMEENGKSPFEGYETPIQVRLTSELNVGEYSGYVAYEPTALEIFGREDVSDARRRCQPDESDPVAIERFDLHRRVTIAYTIYWSVRLAYDVTEEADEALLDVGLDPYICDENRNNTCDDIATPWGYAKQVMDEYNNVFFSVDGFNAQGSLNREYNKIRYSDFRDDNDRYIPVNSPWKIYDINRWQPLLESDNLGFLYFQEHVVPHIGFTGKSYFFSNEEICNAVSDEPNYDYVEEIELTFERLKNLSDKDKMEIETFDDKQIFNRFRSQYLNGLGVGNTGWEGAVVRSLVQFTLYEAIIVVWKEKIRYDKIRPPSYVHEKFPDRDITTYAGTTADGESFGTQTLKGIDWEPYIRTMPHAEYPSASACMCRAITDAFATYFGSDNITNVLPNGVELFVPAFSSEVEPLSTPKEDLTLRYYSWSEISDACGLSRLAGGMHFTASVPAGSELCSYIGPRMAQAFIDLKNGVKPQFVVDINEPSIIERDCYTSDSSSSSSGSSSRGSSRSSSRSSSSSE